MFFLRQLFFKKMVSFSTTNRYWVVNPILKFSYLPKKPSSANFFVRMATNNFNKMQMGKSVNNIIDEWKGMVYDKYKLVTTNRKEPLCVRKHLKSYVKWM